MATTEQICLSDRLPGLAIIADDLTGALDAAAPFAERGVRVRVATRAQALCDGLAGAEVVAVSTRSREISPSEAEAEVRAALLALPAGVRVFKKVDSRLKGHIAAELRAFGDVPVLAVPALPEFDRVVRDGAVQGWGVDQPIPVADRLGRDALIPDVETLDDMRAALLAAPGHMIVGARGAAVALAEGYAVRPHTRPALTLPMVIVVGSTDPITLAQVAALITARPDIRHVEAPDGHAAAAPAPGVTLLQAVPGAGASGAEVAANLALCLRPLAEEAATLVLTGGATAEAALDALGVTVLELEGEQLPGLPVARGGPWRIVTKSGGFGHADTLLTLAMGAGA
ncbi:MAG: four-carbon acid sugar kinase family protein [Gemmobacter sp.]